jgi:DNA-binding beta-propeller fold protein YncE
MRKALSAALLVMLASSGCGATHARTRHETSSSVTSAATAPSSAAPAATSAPQTRARRSPFAFITAETENRLWIVSLAGRPHARSVAVPAGPQYVAAEAGAAVLSSPQAGAVTLLGGDPLQVRRVLRDFGTPRVVAISPDGEHAYVTDDADGTVTVIRFLGERIVYRLAVGAGAHHFSFSPDQSRVWVALGESARTIVILDSSHIEHPRVLGHFDPGFPAHDLAFSPDGREVWVSSASGHLVTVFSARDHRSLFTVPVGAPPQHIAFDGADVYLTSGYGRTVEEVAVETHRVLKRAITPYGSFELDAGRGFVVTASLLNGQLAIFTPGLRPLRTLPIAPATRDVELSNSF